MMGCPHSGITATNYYDIPLAVKLARRKGWMGGAAPPNASLCLISHMNILDVTGK
jgi:hypothetical protein